jgi:magnesium-transporting ATPase (P-type)
MATLNHNCEGQALVFVKGAPEQILLMCASQYGVNGKAETLNINYWNEKAEAIAGLGQRVLAFAVKSFKSDHVILKHDDVEGTLQLLGMVGMIDPPRAEAIVAVKECHRAGIRVKMITGDHA